MGRALSSRRASPPLASNGLIVASIVLAVVGCRGDTHWVAASEDGAMELSVAFVGESATGESSALYFALRNTGVEDDALEEVIVDGVGWAEIHESVERGGMRVMSPVAEIEVPGHALVRLAPGETHVMLRNLSRLPSPGDSLTGELRFRSGRTLDLRAEVRALTELEGILAFVVPTGAGH